MSDYRNFVQDFPKRCRDLLREFSSSAARRDREVTLLLMAAAAGFVMSYERLSEGTSIVQPPLDRPQFAKEMAELKTLLGERVGSSAQFGRLLGSWYGGPLQSAVGMPDDWPECRNPTMLAPSETVGRVVGIVRNAIAHGNVLTRAGNQGQIGHIVLVSGGTKRNGTPIPLRYVMLTPSQLHDFLLAWFDYLANLKLPPDMVTAAIEEAA